MREIKFRAWDKLAKKMFDNGYYEFIFLRGQITGIVDVIEGTRVTHIMPKLKIMQFTGTVDKHKWDIYEGDILKFNSYNENGNSGKVVGEVMWNENESAWYIYADNSEFGLGTKNGLFLSWAKNISILGNIYENEDLIISLQKEK